MTPEERAKLIASAGAVTGDQAQMWARILLLGPAKLGKTTAIASTCVKPCVINCDGKSALKETRRRGVDPIEFPCYSRAQRTKAMSGIKALIKAGEVRTVLFDSVTMFAENIIREMEVSLSGHDLWREYGKLLSNTMRELCELEAHLFIIGHLGAKEDFEPGVLPCVPGQSKTKIPAAVDDWIIFDFEAGRKPHERVFLLGPQKGWNAGGRNIKRTTMTEATTPALFAEMGLEL